MPRIFSAQRPVHTRNVPVINPGSPTTMERVGGMDLPTALGQPPGVEQRTLSVQGGNPALEAFADAMIGVINPELMLKKQEQRRSLIEKDLDRQASSAAQESQLGLQTESLRRLERQEKLATERENRLAESARLARLDVTKDSKGNIFVIDKEKLLSAQSPEEAQSAITTIRSVDQKDPKTAIATWEKEFGIAFTPEEKLLLTEALKGDETDIKSALNSVVSRRQSASRGDEAREFGNQLRTFAAEDRMATEYRQQPEVKDYFDIQSAFDRVQQSAGAASPAGDLSMIFNYMKMLDPGSVVRESEFRVAETARPLLSRVGLDWNRLKAVWAGQRLTPEQRADFLARAQDIFAKAQSRKKKVDKDFTDRAKRRRLEPMNIIRETTEDETAPAKGAAKPTHKYVPGKGIVPVE